MVLENLREDRRFESGIKRLFCPVVLVFGLASSGCLLAQSANPCTWQVWSDCGCRDAQPFAEKGCCRKNGGGNADRGNATSAVAGKGLLPNGRAGVGRVLAQPWHTAEMSNRLPEVCCRDKYVCR